MFGLCFFPFVFVAFKCNNTDKMLFITLTTEFSIFNGNLIYVERFERAGSTSKQKHQHLQTNKQTKHGNFQNERKQNMEINIFFNDYY